MLNVKNPIVITFISFIVLFTIFELTIPNSYLILLLDCLSIPICAAILFIYGPHAWRTFKSNKPEISDLLILGIALSWISIFIIRVLRSLTILFLDGSGSLVMMNFSNEFISGAIRIANLFTLMAGVLHLLVKNYDGKGCSRESIYIISGSLTFGLILFFIVISFFI